MVHVASEMERQGVELPLLIGGATTSKVHTAVKIEPAYHGPVVHVLDASRSVGVVSALTSEDGRDPFVQDVREEYGNVRARYEGADDGPRGVSIEEARANRFAIDWSEVMPPRPKLMGRGILKTTPLKNWCPELIGRLSFMPGSFTARIREFWRTKSLVKRPGVCLLTGAGCWIKLSRKGCFTARGMIGFWPANADGDDIVLYDDVKRASILATVHTLRQQGKKSAGRPHYALADFVAPKESGVADWFGGFSVAIFGADELAKLYEDDNDDYNAIMVKALADRLAEAFAERLHERVRKEYWGYARDEVIENDDMIQERYQGIRPAPGYPACPDHTEKETLFKLLDADRLGVTLTESFAMHPAAAVSGWYFLESRIALFWGWQDQPGPSSGLRRT